MRDDRRAFAMKMNDREARVFAFASGKPHLVEVAIEDSTRRYLAVPAFLKSRPRYDDRVRILGPLDPLLWDRDLVRHAFEFDYVWELFFPPEKRRWGWYVLPLLFGATVYTFSLILAVFLFGIGIGSSIGSVMAHHSFMRGASAIFFMSASPLAMKAANSAGPAQRMPNPRCTMKASNSLL